MTAIRGLREAGFLLAVGAALAAVAATLWVLIGSGEFTPILGWLQEKIYSQGKRYLPSELIQRVTGEPMMAKYYLEGMGEKYLGVEALGR